MRLLTPKILSSSVWVGHRADRAIRNEPRRLGRGLPVTSKSVTTFSVSRSVLAMFLLLGPASCTDEARDAAVDRDGGVSMGWEDGSGGIEDAEVLSQGNRRGRGGGTRFR